MAHSAFVVARRDRWLWRLAATTVLVLALLACGAERVPVSATPAPATGAVPSVSTPAAATGIHAVRHIVIIVQENHSFDHYLGTFPGAAGIPMENGIPTACLPDPASSQCVRPFHDPRDVHPNPPHSAADYARDIDGGLMDGFIRQFRAAGYESVSLPDVVGYHDDREIPNYWRYAREFVLQDHLFEPVASWTLPSHLFLLSGWSAICASSDPMSCRTQLAHPEVTRSANDPRGLPYAWTDITYLLHRAGVSWAYYVADGAQPECLNSSVSCVTRPADPRFALFVDPLARFETVHLDDELQNIKPVSQFYEAAAAGTLPSVSWVVPDKPVSEHPPASIHLGEQYVTGLVNAVMRSPNWGSTAILLIWDEGGGFYDHLAPPIADGRSLGVRIPGLVISPYAKRGYVDHQTLSYGAYLKFIEDDFLGGQRLDPKTTGRPDPRPTVLEDEPPSGDLMAAFDFGQAPRSPLILPTD